RDRRLKMAIDYEFFQALVREEVAAKDAQKRGRTPSDDPKDAVWRETIDATSAQLLDRLENLSAEARGGLGRYRRIDRDRWKREVNELKVSNRAAIDLADATFSFHFPQWKDKDFLDKAIGQVWQAIVLDKVKALQEGTSLQTLVFPKGKAGVDEEGSLKPGEGKVFLARLEEGQSIATSVLTDRTIGFSVYTPNGEALRSDSQELNWSGKLPATGFYQIVVVSRSNDTLSYKLTLTTDTLQ
ncbi:hypothetical protein VB714_02645, partial [Spirulina sp. 06S082]